MNSCPRAPAPVLSPNCDARLLMSSPSAEMAAVLKERSGLQRLRNSDTTGPSEDCSPDTEEREIDPLHVAAAKGQLDIVIKLIRFGVEIDRSKPGSHTAIPVTMMKCRNPSVMINIILYLIEAGCHPTVDNVRLAIRKAPQVGVQWR